MSRIFQKGPFSTGNQQKSGSGNLEETHSIALRKLGIFCADKSEFNPSKKGLYGWT